MILFFILTFIQASEFYSLEMLNTLKMRFKVGAEINQEEIDAMTQKYISGASKIENLTSNVP